ncbi:amino acid permease [Ferruginibacter sp. HRS2-29]|uniref:amino acid permease n=1 Tax=Ferruginibacter sp. HRS2-29 TaxID=2487334 RepID=UPI0020CE90AC|nr:amino acid permease [Ferruginibacter sp. HRS2-29]MCP9753422.1 amino acid permease [Ferruginibacter sp. HRS2-29]
MSTSLFRKKSIDVILKDAAAGLGDGEHGGGGLKKVLGVKDLTFFGVAAVIGAGVFSSIGKASYDGGPGVIYLYIFTAIACGFAALCYAEFASTVPVSGSAYTYSYVAFGEIFAWIIGWDLLMEYAIGNIAVAISWSDYFTNLMNKAGLHIADWLTMDYTTAHHGFTAVTEELAKGSTLASLDPAMVEKYNAWITSPTIGGLHCIMDLPAFCIVGLITAVVFVGIKESRSLSNIMVMIKLAVIFLVVVVGASYVNTDNWSPFTPNGIGGILKGVSAVFFAYIGFDAISTTAEECKDPQRDLPRGMIYSLIICTILYVLLGLVLTGMVRYTSLNVGDPLALVFDQRGLKWIGAIVAFSAIIATASVLLVFQMGQPRIWMSMSRDGLLPKIFSRIHPKFHTPSFSTILTGLVVAIPALFLNLEVVLALTSIGTLFAFILVCGGILVLQGRKDKAESKFKVPYINGRFILPVLFILALFLGWKYNNDSMKEFFNNKLLVAKENMYDRLGADSVQLKTSLLQLDGDHFNQYGGNVKQYLDSSFTTKYRPVIRKSGLPEKTIYYTGSEAFLLNFPQWLFVIVALIFVILTFVKKFSLIPVLGLVSCFYLMAQESHTNWLRFLIWLIIGLMVYFVYSYKNSKLSPKKV